MRILLGARGKNQKNPAITIKLNKMSKITKEELVKVQEQQKELSTVINQIGQIEAQKHSLLHQIASIIGEIDETKKELEAKYGSVNINIEDGSYTEIEKDEANKED